MEESSSVKPEMHKQIKIENRHKKYMALDTETGGFSAKDCDILSIGYVVTTRRLKTIEKGEILIKGDPERVQEQALKVNKINLEEHNKIALTPEQAASQFQEIISKHWDNNKPTLIGQNVPFDIGFVRALFESTDRKFTPDYTTIDLKPIWQALVAFGKVKTADAKQDTILTYLKIRSAGKRHSALTDAVNVLKILRKIKKYIKEF